VDFCYFTQRFRHKKFRGTCSYVEMWKGYMVRERLGIPGIESNSRVDEVSLFEAAGTTVCFL